jgi:hypothetical protein
MATKFTKGGIDGIIVLNVRELLFRPFEAPGWVDLRVGWLLSITQALNNDAITGLTDSIGTDPVSLNWDDRVRIGLTNSGGAHGTGTIFCGFTNRGLTPSLLTAGSSKLVSSDIGIGTTNTNFWRVQNDNNNVLAAQIVVGSSQILASSLDGLQQHFVQNEAGAGGYATLVMMRFQRPDAQANAKQITISIPKMPSGHSSDVLFTNTPTEAFLRSHLEATFPATVQQFGPFTLTEVPDTMILYWPFTGSRLRIHAKGFAKVR